MKLQNTLSPSSGFINAFLHKADSVPANRSRTSKHLSLNVGVKRGCTLTFGYLNPDSNT